MAGRTPKTLQNSKCIGPQVDYFKIST